MSVIFDQQAYNLIEQLEKASLLSDPSKIRKSTSNFLVHFRRFQERSGWNLDQIFKAPIVADRIKQNPELTKSFTKPLEIFLGLYPSVKKQHSKRIALCKSLQFYLGNYNSRVVQKSSDKLVVRERGKSWAEIIGSSTSPRKTTSENSTEHPPLLDPSNPFYIPPFNPTQQITPIITHSEPQKPPIPPRPISYTPRPGYVGDT